MNEFGIHKKNELTRGFRVCWKTIKVNKDISKANNKQRAFLFPVAKRRLFLSFLYIWDVLHWHSWE